MQPGAKRIDLGAKRSSVRAARVRVRRTRGLGILAALLTNDTTQNSTVLKRRAERRSAVYMYARTLTSKYGAHTISLRRLRHGRAAVEEAVGHRKLCDNGCLLYTSPSPRD